MNNFEYESYNYENKIPKERYDVIHKIIVENENEINGRDNSGIDMYNKWVNLITNTPRYNILVCKMNNVKVTIIKGISDRPIKGDGYEEQLEVYEENAPLIIKNVVENYLPEVI